MQWIESVKALSRYMRDGVFFLYYPKHLFSVFIFAQLIFPMNTWHIIPVIRAGLVGRMRRDLHIITA